MGSVGVPILQLAGVSKSFGDLKILDGVDLSVHNGEIVSILGPSGSGKSTLLHVAGLMEKASAGDVHLGGKNMGPSSEEQKSRDRLNTIGFLFQFHHLLPDFTVSENVLLPCRLAGDDLHAKKADADALVSRLGLSDRGHHRPQQLSGGEQQRAAHARALIRKPQILLCDEPTGNLDTHTADGVWGLIREEIISKDATRMIESVYQLIRKAVEADPFAIVAVATDESNFGQPVRDVRLGARGELLIVIDAVTAPAGKTTTRMPDYLREIASELSAFHVAYMQRQKCTAEEAWTAMDSLFGRAVLEFSTQIKARMVEHGWGAKEPHSEKTRSEEIP